MQLQEIRKAGNTKSLTFEDWVSTISKPGWRSFLICLLIWYVAILIYSQGGYYNDKFLFLLKFYSRWSWPNFLLLYLLFTTLLPFALKRKNKGVFLLVVITTTLIFIAVRYMNHVLQDPEYYFGYDINNNKYPRGIRVIVGMELTIFVQFFFIALGLRLLVDRFELYQKEQEIKKMALHAEIVSLRNQISPHFLFNAFNNIYSMAIAKDSKTPDALLKLSQMFRYVLSQSEELVLITTEIDHIQRLISFERLRFPYAIIHWSTDVAATCSRRLIPPLLLSTLVENCFKHGDPGNVQNPINIQLNCTAEALNFSVINPLHSNPAQQRLSSGTGLANLKRRLELYYPEKHTFSHRKENDRFIAELIILF